MEQYEQWSLSGNNAMKIDTVDSTPFVDNVYFLINVGMHTSIVIIFQDLEHNEGKRQITLRVYVGIRWVM